MATPADLTNLFLWCDADLGRFDATVGGSSVTADAATIARWEDQSGNARHLTQSTSGNRPLYDATKGLVVGAMPDLRFFSCPGSFTLNRQAFSLFMVCELSALRQVMNAGSVLQYHFITQSSTDSLNIHYDGVNGSNMMKLAVYDGVGFKVSSVVPLTTELCLIGFVGTGTEFRVWLDGTRTDATVLASGSSTLTSILGYAANGVLQAGVKDLIVYDRALSDSEVTNTIMPYAVGRSVAASRQHQIVFEGDSITHGFGSTVNRNWPSRLSGIATSVRRRVTAESGITLATLATNAAARIDPLVIGGETNILTIFAGTNDIGGGANGVDTYNALASYIAARQSAGWKVIAFTMLDRVGFDATQDIYRATFNTSLRALATVDGLVDVDADGRLDDANDATYFSDGTHPTNAGYAVIAELAEPVIAGLIPVATGNRRRRVLLTRAA